MQVLEEKLPKLSIEETQEEQARSLTIIPKKKMFNYPFGFWVPSDHHVDDKFSILTTNGLLVSFAMLAKSKECENCGKQILPIPHKNMVLPESCPYCKFNPRKSKPVERQQEIKKSSTFVKLDSLLTEAGKNYNLHANFERKSDYSENWHHEENHEMYLKYGIVKDASEIKTCIDSLLSFDGFTIRNFTKNGKTYKQMFDEIVNNESILKLEPFYSLLSMATSIIKAPQMIIKPLIRGSRMSPANVTNMMQPLSKRA